MLFFYVDLFEIAVFSTAASDLFFFFVFLETLENWADFSAKYFCISLYIFLIERLRIEKKTIF